MSVVSICERNDRFPLVRSTNHGSRSTVQNATQPATGESGWYSFTEYLWHLTIFATYYQSLEVYREDIVVPLGVLSMVIQGIVWAVIYERMFAGETIAGCTF